MLGRYASTPAQYLDAPDHPVGKEQDRFLEEMAPSVQKGMQKLAHYLQTGEGPPGDRHRGGAGDEMDGDVDAGAKEGRE